MSREIGDIIRLFQRRRSEPLALATLVRSRGSSYRQPGARMLITPDGETVGTLSGGCLEEEIARDAAAVIATGRPALLAVDTRARFGCHGMIEIFVERVSGELLHGVAAAQRQRESCVAVTTFAGDTPLGTRLGESGAPCDDAFRQQIDPPVRLIIVGHAPDSQPLQSLARVLGWECVTTESIADLAVPLDRWTAAVIGTHNYGRDFAALRQLLHRGLPYVGLIGARRRREQLLGDLLDTGAEPGTELFGPAGLDLGAESPEQIALAIVAEISAVLGAGSGRPLRELRRPVRLRAGRVESDRAAQAA